MSCSFLWKQGCIFPVMFVQHLSHEGSLRRKSRTLSVCLWLLFLFSFVLFCFLFLCLFTPSGKTPVKVVLCCTESLFAAFPLFSHKPENKAQRSRENGGGCIRLRDPSECHCKWSVVLRLRISRGRQKSLSLRCLSSSLLGFGFVRKAPDSFNTLWQMVSVQTTASSILDVA